MTVAQTKLLRALEDPKYWPRLRARFDRCQLWRLTTGRRKGVTLQTAFELEVLTDGLVRAVDWATPKVAKRVKEIERARSERVEVLAK